MFSLRWNVLTLSIIGAVIGLANSSIELTQQPFMLDIVGDIMLISLLLSFFSLISSLISLFGGFLADKYGRKLTMIEGFVLSFVGVTLMFVSHGTSLLILAMTVWSVGAAIPKSATIAMLAESANKEKRSKAFSYFGTLSTLGQVLGPFIGGFLFATCGIRGPVFLALIMYFLLIATSITLLRETQARRKRLLPFNLTGIREIHNSLPDPRSLYMLILAEVVLGFGGSVGRSLLILYAQKSLKATPFDIGLIMGATYLFMLIFMIPAGLLADRIGRVTLLLLEETLTIIIPIGFALSHEPYHLIALQSILGFGLAMGTPGWLALQTELMPARDRAKLLSFYDFVSLIARMPGPYLSGLVWTLQGPRQMFLLSSALSWPTLLIVYFGVKDTLKKIKCTHDV